MAAADKLMIQSPEKMRNTWSLAMRSFANCRSNCQVAGCLDYATTETGCIMSNANSKDLADLGVEVLKDSVTNVKKCLDDSEQQQYTLSFTDSENALFEARLTNEDVDDSFLSTPKSLVHSIYFTASNNTWPTQSNRGLRSILNAFMNNDDHIAVDHLLAVPSKAYTTSLPLQTGDRPQTVNATCNAYELRDNNQQVLQEFMHTQCKFQELQGEGVNVGHLILETLSLKDKITGYTASVQLTVSNDQQIAEDMETTGNHSNQATPKSVSHSVHVIHADAHFTMQMRCSDNQGCRKLQLPAFAALHELQACQSTNLNYKNLMRTSNLQNLHLGFGIASLVLRSSTTPIVFMVLPCCKSPNFETSENKCEPCYDDANDLQVKDQEMDSPTNDEYAFENLECDNLECDNLECDKVKQFEQKYIDHSHFANSVMEMVSETAGEQSTIVMREPQVRAEEAFYASYTEVFQQDPIMRQALFRRSNREV